MRSTLNDIEVVFIHSTDDAIKVSADEDATPVWLPKSQCKITHPGDDDPSPNTVVTLTAHEGVLIAKGLL